MSTIPRFEILAHTERGDLPRYTDHPTMVRVLVDEARRSPHTGAITVEDRCNEVAVTGWPGEWDDLDSFVAGLVPPAVPARRVA